MNKAKTNFEKNLFDFLIRKSISIILQISVAALALTFFSLITISAQQVKKTKNYSPLGKMVDAGGHLLHLNCTGKGKSTVVIEAGTGDFSVDWSLVQPKVANFARVCTYDRAGYAWSEPGPIPRTFEQITLELHTALKNAGEKAPFILVGHSYGGFLVRAYARYFPKEVAGIILVDAVNEDSRVIVGGEAFRIREWAKGREFPAPQIIKIKTEKPKSETVNSGENRLEPPLDKLPPKMQEIRLWAQSLVSSDEARQAEIDWSSEELAQMYANRGKPEYMLGDIPLIVISRGKGGYEDVSNASAKELEEERVRLQNDLAKLSTDSKHIVTETDEHNIHLADPKLVIDSIREMVKTIRNTKNR